MPFLFVAWTIIFVHSIIPHHHHSDDILSECVQYNVNTIHVEHDEIHDCDLDCNNFACHFQVKILSQVSIDNIFIVNTENSVVDHLCFKGINTLEYYSYFISDQIPRSKFLRGPPQISIS